MRARCPQATSVTTGFVRRSSPSHSGSWPVTERLRSGADVLVIGGGIHGLSTALHLARAGVRVTVLEAEYCGRHASGVNAGGVRTLGRHVAEIPLALASRTLWHGLQDVLGEDGGFVASGQLKLAENDAELQECQRRVEQLHALGFTHEVLIDRQQVLELVPTVAPHVVGGIWVGGDGYAVPYHTVTAFRLAAQRLGVRVLEQTPALRIERSATHWRVETRSGVLQAEHLVVTAGAWAAQLAAQVGEPVPVHPQGLMLMVTHRVAPFCAPVLGATGRALSFKQFANGTVVIGGKLVGSVEFAARHGEVQMDRLSTSARTVTDLFPHLRNLGVNRVWAGVEAFTADDIPVIGASCKTDKLSYSFGFCGSGFQMGPGTGQRLAQQILGEPSPISLDPFSIGRFAQSATTLEQPATSLIHS
ncbi:FAD-binding oxidoreductase [Pseudomonas sp. MBT-2]|uniref:FAD-binding oxidoreductase n=1 Tax=Pseudomonas baltica TaxID=2762576 RepID=A0A7X1G2N6_9PSED|nr:FAD-binding oxidoreductase [Pseudomonas baltica]